MKVILLKNVPKVGKKYEVKEIADGQAQNMLIPRGLAEAATPAALKRIELLKVGEEKGRQVQEELLSKNLEAVSAAHVHIKGKANEKGHLFAGLHKEELSEIIKKETRLDIPAHFIMLEKPIKETGEHMIEIKAGGKSAMLKVIID